MKNLIRLAALCGALVAPSLAHADTYSAGDTAWMLTSSALVLFMLLPGLSLFYAGLVRTKNVLLKLINLVLPLRADQETEQQGLDIVQHGETGYNQ